MKIGYVCTNFNNSSFTREAVRTLLMNRGHYFYVVVVDNCSRAAEKQKLDVLKKEYSCVSVIDSSVNVGYFRGLNIGIRFLRNKFNDIEWIVVGNNDLEFPSDFADRLEANADRFCAYAVISPDVITVEGEHQNPHVIRRISFIREVFYDLYYSNYYIGMIIGKVAKLLPAISERSDEQQWQIAQPIYQGHGSCYLLTPKFFEQFDGFWAPTFLMGEEFFLSKQLSDVRQQVFYDPVVKVVHHWHGSLERLPNKMRWEMARDAHREYRKYVKV